MTAPALNEIVHQPVRLKIMAALDTEPEGKPLDFTRLKAVSGATDGNLGAHLGTLEVNGYIRIAKEPVGRRFRTWVAITPDGRRAFRAHVAYLQTILDGLS